MTRTMCDRCGRDVSDDDTYFTVRLTVNLRRALDAKLADIPRHLPHGGEVDVCTSCAELIIDGPTREHLTKA